MREVRRVTHEQRVTQLRELLSALGDLVAGLVREQRFLEAVPEYEGYRDRVAALLQGRFDQAALDEVAITVPRLFWLHKEWLPPLDDEAPPATRLRAARGWRVRLSAGPAGPKAVPGPRGLRRRRALSATRAAPEASRRGCA